MLAGEEVLEALDGGMRAEWAQIRAALQRLDGGGFGVCEGCGGAIAPRRLEALPWTTRCVGCAEQAGG